VSPSARGLVLLEERARELQATDALGGDLDVEPGALQVELRLPKALGSEVVLVEIPDELFLRDAEALGDPGQLRRPVAVIFGDPEVDGTEGAQGRELTQLGDRAPAAACRS
jgi:hypothetical protein